MTVIAVILGCVSVVLVGLFAWGQRETILPKHLRSRVIVTLKTKESFRGVIVDVDRVSMTLRHAELLAVGQRAPVTLDGDIVLIRADVAYLQKP